MIFEAERIVEELYPALKKIGVIAGV